MNHPTPNSVRFGATVLLIAGSLFSGLSSAALAQPTTEAPQRFDLSADRLVDDVDAGLLTQAWLNRQYDGTCDVGALASADYDNDACLSVVDVQTLLAHWGETAQGNGLVTQAGGTPQAEATFSVNSTSDAPDANPGDGVCLTSNNNCTLRAAIQESNRRAGRETIAFNIRNPNGTCPDTVKIYPKSTELDQLTVAASDNAGVVIDGYTQCGASPNTAQHVGNAVIKVQIVGNRTKGVDGIQVFSANNVIRGLSLYDWDHQIYVAQGGAKYNKIQGNFLGTDPANKFTQTGLGTHHSEAIRFAYGANYNVLGCGSFDAANMFQPCTDSAQAYAARNIVSGAGNDGLHVEGGARYNHFVGNYVGLKQDGATGLGNKSDGVDFEQGPQFNWLGGPSDLERNIISGNGSEGIEISHGNETTNNWLVNNYFGTDSTGMKGIQNHANGVSFEDKVRGNIVEGNLVSGNNGNGFRFYVLARYNIVRNNVVGVASDGVTPLPNGRGTYYGQAGVYAMGGSSWNRIEGNIIANNPQFGIKMDMGSDKDNNEYGETYYNTVSRNSMYNNGQEGIRYYGKRGNMANMGLAAPKLVAANTAVVNGTACAGCTVEIFVADKTTVGGGDPAGEGKTFIGDGIVAADGTFAVPVSGVLADQIVTATATDSLGNTSTFSTNVKVNQAPPSTPTPVTPTVPVEPPPVTPTTGPGEPPVTPTTGPGEPPTTTTPVVPTVTVGPAPSSRLFVPIATR